MPRQKPCSERIGERTGKVGRNIDNRKSECQAKDELLTRRSAEETEAAESRATACPQTPAPARSERDPHSEAQERADSFHVANGGRLDELDCRLLLGGESDHGLDEVDTVPDVASTIRA